jgi:RNA polymerase sigma-70 factor (ECF subfamily)
MKIRFRLKTDKTPVEQSRDWNKCLEDVGQKRDKQAFAELFEHFSPLLKSFLLKSGGQGPENVEELVQDTMVKVWRKADNYSAAQGSASTWIYTVARNTRIDAIRKQVRQNPRLLHAEDIYYNNEEQTPHTSLIHIRDKKQISEKLRHLPAEQVEVLTLMFFQGKSGQQVADLLGLPLGTVKSRIRLALAKLKLGLAASFSDSIALEGDSNDK